jgi:hypothetical protein
MVLTDLQSRQSFFQQTSTPVMFGDPDNRFLRCARYATERTTAVHPGIAATRCSA